MSKITPPARIAGSAKDDRVKESRKGPNRWSSVVRHVVDLLFLDHD